MLRFVPPRTIDVNAILCCCDYSISTFIVIALRFSANYVRSLDSKLNFICRFWMTRICDIKKRNGKNLCRNRTTAAIGIGYWHFRFFFSGEIHMLDCIFNLDRLDICDQLMFARTAHMVDLECLCIF